MKAINLFAFKALNLEGACESLHSSKLPFHNYICLLGGEIKVKTVHKNNQNDKLVLKEIYHVVKALKRKDARVAAKRMKLSACLD